MQNMAVGAASNAANSAASVSSSLATSVSTSAGLATATGAGVSVSTAVAAVSLYFIELSLFASLLDYFQSPLTQSLHLQFDYCRLQALELLRPLLLELAYSVGQNKLCWR